MKKTWAKRKNVVVKRTKKSNIPPLVISEHHRAHIPARYCVFFFTVEGVSDFLPLFYHSHVQSSTHESNEELESEGIPSDVPQDDEDSNEDKEEGREVLERTLEENPTLNAGTFLPTSKDVDRDMPTGAPEPTDIIFDSSERQNVSGHCH